MGHSKRPNLSLMMTYSIHTVELGCASAARQLFGSVGQDLHSPHPRVKRTFGLVANQFTSAKEDESILLFTSKQSIKRDVKWPNAAPNKRIARFQSKF